MNIVRIVLCALCMITVLLQGYILLYPGGWSRSSAVFVAGLAFWWYIIPAIAYTVFLIRKRNWRIDAIFLLSVLFEILVLFFPVSKF
jgi:hypothetical protein